MKNKLILITVVRKIPNTFDTRDCLHTFIAPECGRKKVIVGSRGEHVLQRPIASDANGHSPAEPKQRSCSSDTGNDGRRLSPMAAAVFVLGFYPVMSTRSQVSRPRPRPSSPRPSRPRSPKPRSRPQTPRPQPHVTAALPVPHNARRMNRHYFYKALEYTCNLFNNGEQSLNCYSVMGSHR